MKNLIFIWFLPFFIFANNGEKSAFESMPEDIRSEISKNLTMNTLITLFSLNKNLHAQFPERFTEWLRENEKVFRINPDKNDIEKLKWLNNTVTRPVLKIKLVMPEKKETEEILDNFINVISLELDLPEYSPSLGLKGFKIFLDHANIKNLTSLKFISNHFYVDLPKDGFFLGKNPNLQKLTSLNLYGNYFYNIVDKIVEGDSFHRLTYLDIGKNLIENKEIAFLAESGRLPNLVILRLNDNGITNEGAIALSEAKNLEKLYLNNNKIKIEGVQALLASSKLTSLKELFLRQINFSNEERKIIEELANIKDIKVFF